MRGCDVIASDRFRSRRISPPVCRRIPQNAAPPPGRRRAGTARRDRRHDRAAPIARVEFRRLAVARCQRIDFLLEPVKRSANHFAAGRGIRQPMRGGRQGRKFVSQPIGLAEIVGALHAGLFPEFAHHRLARIFLGVDAALRHLPFQARENDLRAVVPESPSDQDLASGIEQRNARHWDDRVLS